MNLQALLLDVANSQKDIKNLDEKIIFLKNEIKNRKNKSKLIEENTLLKTNHSLFQGDIANYKEDIKKLTSKIQENENKISKLKNKKKL